MKTSFQITQHLSLTDYTLFQVNMHNTEVNWWLKLNSTKVQTLCFSILVVISHSQTKVKFMQHSPMQTYSEVNSSPLNAMGHFLISELKIAV